MSDPLFAQPLSPPAKNEGLGCFLKGCLILTALFVIFAGLASWGAYSLYKNIYALTSAAAAALPVAEPSPEKYMEVKGRLDQFRADSDANKPATLRLTAEDLNTMVAAHPAYSDAKGHVYFEIQDGKLTIQTCFPLTRVPTMRDRYLNATMALSPSIEDGTLTLQPTMIKAGAYEASPDVLKTLQSFHWGDQLDSNPEFRKLMRLVKSLKMDGDAIVFETK